MKVDLTTKEMVAIGIATHYYLEQQFKLKPKLQAAMNAVHKKFTKYEDGLNKKEVK